MSQIFEELLIVSPSWNDIALHNRPTGPYGGFRPADESGIVEDLKFRRQYWVEQRTGTYRDERLHRQRSPVHRHLLFRPILNIRYHGPLYVIAEDHKCDPVLTREGIDQGLDVLVEASAGVVDDTNDVCGRVEDLCVHSFERPTAYTTGGQQEMERREWDRNAHVVRMIKSIESSAMRRSIARSWP